MSARAARTQSATTERREVLLDQSTSVSSAIEESASPRSLPKRATWRGDPQRVWLRRAIFQVHLLVGVVLALYSVVIGLSGSALVFKDEIDHVANPALYHVAPSDTQVSLTE